ncbi:MAG: hypothetical protein WCY29_10070 [Novosphingobium sp.]
MADYFSPTVVQPTIPQSAMTPLERLLLSRIFTSEPDGDGLYFYADQGINDMPAYAVEEVRAALAASGDVDSQAADLVRAELAKLGADAVNLQLDMSAASWETIFQSVIRRTPTLAYVSVISAWTCSKMRPDGFGGMAVLITTDDVMVRSTESMLDEMLGLAEYGRIGVEPGLGSHVLLSLDEEDVVAEIDRIFAATPPPGIDRTEIALGDVRTACERNAAYVDYADSKRYQSLLAALHAVCIAAARKHAAR